MWTIFCCPKRFSGETGALQERAIHSWMQLRPGPEIILLGDEDGVARFARERRLRHVAAIQRNAHGTPLVPSVFASGQQAATQPIACYVNADIVLLQDFAEAIDVIREVLPAQWFLAFGGRWNLPPGQVWDPGDGASSKILRARLEGEGWLDDLIAMDYFVFPREIDWRIPPFALGRRYWDSWFPWKAWSMRIPLIDLTRAVTAVHVEHSYDHAPGVEQPLSPEVETNRKLLGFWRRFTIEDSTHLLMNSALHRRSGLRRWAVPRLRRLERMTVHYLRDAGIPGLAPLYQGLRTVKRAVRSTRTGPGETHENPSSG
jgi:hypothetical protein